MKEITPFAVKIQTVPQLIAESKQRLDNQSGWQENVKKKALISSVSLQEGQAITIWEAWYDEKVLCNHGMRHLSFCSDSSGLGRGTPEEAKHWLRRQSFFTRQTARKGAGRIQ